jgi:hypothetical protein
MKNIKIHILRRATVVATLFATAIGFGQSLCPDEFAASQGIQENCSSGGSICRVVSTSDPNGNPVARLCIFSAGANVACWTVGSPQATVYEKWDYGCSGSSCAAGPPTYSKKNVNMYNKSTVPC